MNNVRNTYSSLLAKIKSSPVTHRFAIGTFWGLLSTIITRLFSMITSIFIARMLGADNFGVYGIIQSTLHIGLLVGYALGGTLTKYIAEYKYKDNNKLEDIINLIITLSLITSITMSILLVVSSSWLASNILNRTNMASLLYLGALLLLSSSLTSVQMGAISGFENFKEIAKLSSIQAILVLILSIPLVYYFGVHGAIIALIISNAIVYIISEIVLKKEFITYNLDIHYFDISSFKEIPIIWKFAMPNLVGALFIVPATWISNTILVHENNGYSELGLFNAANQWRQLIAFLPQILTVITLPILSETYGRENKNDNHQAFKINLRLTWSYALPMTIFVILFRNPISYLFGSQFTGMTEMMILLMIASFINILSSVISTTMLSSGNVWTLAIFNLLFGTVLVLSASLLTKLYGGVGLSMAYFIATTFMIIIQIIYIEINMKQYAFSGERLLIFVSIITLLFVGGIGYYNYSSMLIGMAVFIISLLPFLRSGFKYIKNI